MGYTHGKKQADGEAEESIMNMVNTLKLDHFPTKSEMIEFYGNRSLAEKVSKSGGSRYYASKLNLRLADCKGINESKEQKSKLTLPFIQS